MAGSSQLDEATRELRPSPVLVVTTPGPLEGQRFALVRERASVGRAAGSDVQIDDAHISRRHAVIGREEDSVWIDDAGSLSGTFVNDAPVTGRTRLATGDQIRLGDIELEVVLAAAPATPSVAEGSPQPHGAGNAPRFDIQSQHAGAISNVGRDQYVSNQLALRIAPMRRRARRLLWLGWGLIFAGLAFGVIEIASYQRQIFDCISSEVDDCKIDFSGLALVPIAMLVVLAGAAMVVAAFLMRRRANREEEAL